MDTRDLNLFVFDTLSNFEETKRFLGEEGLTYKRIIPFETLKEFKDKIRGINDDEKIFVVVHIFSDSLDGVRKFVVSGIIDEYKKLAFKYITNKGTINEMSKRAIDEDLPLCKNDIYKYHGIRDYINTESDKIPTKFEIINGNNKVSHWSNGKKGIFLSHSSSDRDIIIKFRDLILDNGLGCNIKNIMLTSDEANAITENKNIPDAIMRFLTENSGLFIQFVSKSYAESRVCLNEEGAGWVLFKENNFISLILPNSSFSDSTWLMTVSKGSKINNKESLFNIYENRKDFFQEVNAGHLNNKIDEFLNWLKTDYEKQANN